MGRCWLIARMGMLLFGDLRKSDGVQLALGWWESYSSESKVFIIMPITNRKVSVAEVLMLLVMTAAAHKSNL